MMNIQTSRKAAVQSARDESQMINALDALEEKQECVHQQLRELLESLEREHPDQIVEQVVLLDHEMGRYRRFLKAIRQGFINDAGSALLQA